MPDVFGIGTSALLSLQRAIAVTGQNITNVNTEGYSRQDVTFAATRPQELGVGFIGTGVEIQSITRNVDEFLNVDAQERTSLATGAQTLADLLGRANAILGGSETSLSPALDGFFAAVQDVANNPGSLPERQVLIGQGRVLSDRFVNIDDRLSTFNQEITRRITDTVGEINALIDGIADLNAEVQRTNGSNRTPNDILDARDQSILRLSELIGITTVQQSDGSTNVFVGNGQALVVGSRTTSLQAFNDPADISRVNVGVAGVSVPTDLSSFFKGGELGAVLEFRTGTVDTARAQLGLIAVSISELVNSQQALGLDLNGDAGVALFRPPEPLVGASILNAGSGVLDVSIGDVSQLTGARYTLRFDGTNYTVTNNNTNASVTGAGPSLTVDGIDITVTTAPAAGDIFTIDPVSQAAGLFEVEITDPRLIAAASPLRSSTSLTNAGAAQLADLTIAGTAGLPLAGPVTLTFDPDALGAGVPGFTVAGIAGGPIAYDPATDSAGIDVALGDLRFRLNGIPETGDSFRIENNLDGSGDNRNMLLLADLQSRQTLFGGTANFQDGYANLVGDIAVRGQQAESTAATEDALLQQALNAKTAVQGVNLDEEAAKLLQLQASYQAAARLISVADEVLQTFLAATRR
ncbi:MAG: flagellar hook-associated protein FlgK [Pseudomonadota bacterium]